MGVGVSRASADVPQPRELARELRATDFGSTVAAGSDFSLIVTESGDILTAGQAARSWPSEVQAAGGGVVSAAAGGAHALLLQEAGTALAIGSNEEGQCEVPCLEAQASASASASASSNNNGESKDSAAAPSSIQYKSVGAGVAFSAFLRSDGKAHFTGLAGNGRGDAPPLPEGMSYVRASLGSSHALLLRSDGAVVACGNNKQGQCNIPVLPDGLFYVGMSAGDYHSLLLRCDGQVLAFGSDFMGKCDVPQLPEGRYYVDVAAGGGHSLFVRNDGAVFSAGEGDFGQRTVPAIEGGARYIAAAAGSNHSLLLRDDGGVAAFGDNRRGQCELPATVRAKLPPALPEVSVMLGVQLSESGGEQGIVCSVDGTTVAQVQVDLHQLIVSDLRKQLATKLGAACWRLGLFLEGDGSFSFSPPIAIPLDQDARSLGDVLKGLS